ncbi:MAG: hypothetical protein ACKVP3_23355 [Hyphomicrobiaceae bacterium]
MNVDPDGFLRDHSVIALQDANLRAVHGHYWIKKYETLEADRICFLRHPIERAVSHYFWWLSQPLSGNSLHRLVVERQLSFEAFAEIPAIRYFYTRHYFRCVDMKSFAFIGRSERYQEELERLEGLLGCSGAKVSANPNSFEGYAERKAHILDDPDCMQRLRDLFREDIGFYDLHAGR